MHSSNLCVAASICRQTRYLLPQFLDGIHEHNYTFVQSNDNHNLIDCAPIHCPLLTMAFRTLVARETAMAIPTFQDLPDLIPVRMLNEFAYCPRLAYLEWVQGDFADSADTVDGRHQHRRVDKESGDLPPADGMSEGHDVLHARSVYLSAPRVGLVARIDLVESDGVKVTPIDYKRGEVPDVPEGAWEPERVQVCAQGMVLEENGYTCDQGTLYFVASHKRVAIPFSDELRARTLALLAEMRAAMAEPEIPLPLDDSPKCPRCSLCGICLPDEINLLRLPQADEEAKPAEPRRLIAARDDALPLYVQTAGTRVGKSGDEFIITPREGPKQTARLGQTSQVCCLAKCKSAHRRLRPRLAEGSPLATSRPGAGSME
jgi:CRISPR-associated protein Cas1